MWVSTGASLADLANRRFTKLLLLDRNAVECVKLANEQRAITDGNKRDLLDHLRRLDVPGHAFSALLSSWEGEHGRQETPGEKSDCVLREAEELEQFFQHAHVDTRFMAARSDDFGDILSTCIERGWEDRERFLLSACGRLYPQCSEQSRRTIEAELIEMAQGAGVALSDPTFVIALAALHGGQAANNLLKPRHVNTTQSAHNALNDIHIILRVGLVMAICSKLKYRAQVKVVTMDKALSNVLACIRIGSRFLSNDEDMKIVLQYRPSLFAPLPESRASKVLARVLRSQSN